MSQKGDRHSQWYNEGMLWHAAANGRMGDVEKCLKAGVDVNAQHPENGRTALHFAAWTNHVPIMKLLVAAGADVEAMLETTLNPSSIRIVPRRVQFEMVHAWVEASRESDSSGGNPSANSSFASTSQPTGRLTLSFEDAKDPTKTLEVIVCDYSAPEDSDALGAVFVLRSAPVQDMINAIDKRILDAGWKVMRIYRETEKRKVLIPPRQWEVPVDVHFRSVKEQAVVFVTQVPRTM